MGQEIDQFARFSAVAEQDGKITLINHTQITMQCISDIQAD